MKTTWVPQLLFAILYMSLVDEIARSLVACTLAADVREDAARFFLFCNIFNAKLQAGAAIVSLDNYLGASQVCIAISPRDTRAIDLSFSRLIPPAAAKLRLLFAANYQEPPRRSTPPTRHARMLAPAKKSF